MSPKIRLFAGTALAAVMVVMSASEAFAQQLDVGNDSKSSAKSLKKGDKAQKGKKAPAKPVPAKPVESQPQLSNENGRLEGDIIVTGLRENVKSSRNAKRRAQQIVDVVVAQDIGKLPDKNVPEALARIPGIQIDRDRGEGGNVRIRGLDGVMTTVNGSATFSAGDRTTYLNDISSDLVAGIEVYKTRTPDQIEGSQTGVINLTLRRPTDFKAGATYALSARADYADQVKKVNPYYSALVAYNGETSIGKMGFSVNGTYNNVRYSERLRFNELPVQVNNSSQSISPTTTPAQIFAPFRVGFAGPEGWSRRAAVQGSLQWKPDSHWTVTLEGGYSNQRMLWADNSIWFPITYSETPVPPPALTNIAMAPDGRLVQSLTTTTIDPIGPGQQSYRHKTENYNGRFQVEYVSDRVEFNAWANYQRSNNDSDNIFHWIRFSQQPQVNLVFNDKSDPKGGVSINVENIDLQDRANYVYVDGFNQSKQYTYSGETELKADLRLNTFAEMIDYIKVGFRYANRTYDRAFGARDRGGLRLPIASLPDYELRAVGAGLKGSTSSNASNYLIGDSRSIRASFDNIRGRLVGIDPSYVNYYPTYDPMAAYSGSDGSYAAYAMFHYNIKLLFPIEGTIGSRIVNSLTNLSAIQRSVGFDPTLGRNVTVDTAITPSGNNLDVLPSVNAIIHFTPKLQLRTSWTYDVGRPAAGDINPVLNLNLLNAARPTAIGGNPDLGPLTLNKYDASLEWYFGTTGSISLAVWQWNQDGRIGRQVRPEFLPESPSVPTLVDRPFNLGRGRHRGIEGAATSFFTFLPGILKSFGGSINGTLNLTKEAFPQTNPDGDIVFSYTPFFNVSKYMFNVVGFFERGGLNMRVAYNWRSRRQFRRDLFNPYNNLFVDPVERLDASINYDVTKNITLAIEASNLTKAGDRSYWGSYDVPNDVRYFSRNFSFSVRSRF